MLKVWAPRCEGVVEGGGSLGMRFDGEPGTHMVRSGEQSPMMLFLTLGPRQLGQPQTETFETVRPSKMFLLSAVLAILQ